MTWGEGKGGRKNAIYRTELRKDGGAKGGGAGRGAKRKSAKAKVEPLETRGGSAGERKKKGGPKTGIIEDRGR